MTVFVGDIHGQFHDYVRIIKQYPNSIQIGDLGVGFYYSTGIPYDEPPASIMDKTGATYIRGNHDNPEYCRNDPRCIKDGTIKIINGKKVMFIGGGLSIDKEFRTEGLNYWSDEELSHKELNDMLSLYLAEKPDIMVTHVCPDFMIHHLHSHHMGFTSRTEQCFDQFMGSEHRPQIWIHGHHHKNSDMVVHGTRFICLAINEVKEINW